MTAEVAHELDAILQAFSDRIDACLIRHGISAFVCITAEVIPDDAVESSLPGRGGSTERRAPKGIWN